MRALSKVEGMILRDQYTSGLELTGKRSTDGSDTQ